MQELANSKTAYVPQATGVAQLLEHYTGRKITHKETTIGLEAFINYNM
jgi:hypothetical protein